MGPDKIIEILRKYNMHPSVRRELSLFTLSILDLAYRKLLKNELGFCYEATAALGDKDAFCVFFDESYISRETERMIGRSKDINKVFGRAKKYFDGFKEELEKTKESADADPEKFLMFILKDYPKYMVALGIYNCFWRYSGNEKCRIKMPQALAEKVSEERYQIAKMYMQVEKLIVISTDLIGRKNNFDGSIIRCQTLGEMDSFLKTGKISEERSKELRQRAKSYFYLSFEDEEHVFSCEDIIKRISDEFFHADYKEHKKDSIKGRAAYPGIAKGAVKVINKRVEFNKIEKGDILVAPMTDPEYAPAISKAAAFVTDEGGYLCHAAVLCREMKKPCIIGTKIATKIFKDGDIVEVDGNTGIVRIIKKSN